jgi:hypothetical protein
MRRLGLLIGAAIAAVATSLLPVGAGAATSIPRHFDVRGTVVAVGDGDRDNIACES